MTAARPSSTVSSASAVPRPAVLASATIFTAIAWTVIAVALWPIYRTGQFVTLAVVAIAAGTAIAFASAVGRWPAWGALGATVTVFTVVGVPLAVPGRTVYGVLPEPQGLAELFAGVVLGWRQLVTIDLPVGAYEALLVPALVVLLVGPLLTLLIAARGRRPALAALVPIVAYLLAIAIGPQSPLLPISTTIALSTTLLLWMAARARHRRRDELAASSVETRGAGARALAGATVLVLLAGGAGAAVAGLIAPPENRTVVRTTAERPFSPLEQPSPLAAYRAEFDPVVADLPALTVEGAPAGARIRIAALDSYDGVVFAVGSDAVDSASGSFVRIPTERPPDILPGERTTVTLTVEREHGVWLPTLGEVAAVRILAEDANDLRDDFVYNTTTGTAALVGGVPIGLTYQLDVVLDEEESATGLGNATPGPAAVPGIAQLPEAVIDWVAEVTDGIETPGAQLETALETLREEGYLSHGVDEEEAPSRPGHSLGRLEDFLGSAPVVGDAEQYAATAALIARQLGFPSRVVLGYGPLDRSGATTLVASDRTAWIEVSTADGWRPIDVVSERRELPPVEPDEPVPVVRPQNPAQPPVEEPPVIEDQAPPEIEQTEEEQLDPFWASVLTVLRVLGPLALVLGILASPLVAIAVLKRRRRARRRRHGDPALRILGGWRDVTDAARDVGLDLPATGTRRELAAVIGRPQALVLARVADRAVYAPEEPDHDEADRVWAAADGVRDSLLQSLTVRQRWGATLSTRSLRRYPDRMRVDAEVGKP
ncbi:MAG: transglutaminase domain-containing protein [Microcella sp.]|uniref:transglutaminase domain-containing protein n=1 Tax=Microcella sp. TaxID=1913979 RepID=UPI00331488D4